MILANIQNSVLLLQVQVPNLQSRFMHRAAAFSLSPRLTEVIIFGGSPEWPNNYKSDLDLRHLSNTTILRFGEW